MMSRLSGYDVHDALVRYRELWTWAELDAVNDVRHIVKMNYCV